MPQTQRRLRLVPAPTAAHKHRLFDRIGISISSLCFIHCLITPFLAFGFPFLVTSFHHPLFHVVIALFVLPVGSYAFWQGYQDHGQKRILAFGIPGLLIISLAAFLPDQVLHLVGHTSINVFGSILLITAHYLNNRACRCEHKH